MEIDKLSDIVDLIGRTPYSPIARISTRLTRKGSSPMVEVFDNRIELPNPGTSCQRLKFWSVTISHV